MRLSQRWINKLVQLPERGMGYQVVDIHLKNGTVVRNVLVVNCETIRDSVNFSEEDIVDITPSNSKP